MLESCRPVRFICLFVYKLTYYHKRDLFREYLCLCYDVRSFKYSEEFKISIKKEFLKKYMSISKQSSIFVIVDKVDSFVTCISEHK